MHPPRTKKKRNTGSTSMLLEKRSCRPCTASEGGQRKHAGQIGQIIGNILIQTVANSSPIWRGGERKAPVKYKTIFRTSLIQRGANSVLYYQGAAVQVQVTNASPFQLVMHPTPCEKSFAPGGGEAFFARGGSICSRSSHGAGHILEAGTHTTQQAPPVKF